MSYPVSEKHANTKRLLLSHAASRDIYNKHYHGDKGFDAPKATPNS